MAKKKATKKKSAAVKKTAKKAPKKAAVKKTTAKKAAPKKTAKKKKASGKRELIDTGHDKRYVRRDAEGHFKDVVDVGLSLSMDRRRKATKKAKPGYGDQGDG